MLPQKLSYVIDQAMTTLRLMQNRATPLEVDGIRLAPTKACLWLILERQSRIERLTDMRSLIFLTKLAEFERQCRNMRIDPIVRVGYRIPRRTEH